MGDIMSRKEIQMVIKNSFGDEKCKYQDKFMMYKSVFVC